MTEINLDFDEKPFGEVLANISKQAGVVLGVVGTDLAEQKISIKGAKLSLEDVVNGLTRNFQLHYTRTQLDGGGTFRRLTQEELEKRMAADASVFEDDEFEDEDPLTQEQIDAQNPKNSPGVGVDPDEIPRFGVRKQ